MAVNLLQDYALAVWCGAEQRMRRLLPVAIRMARARLKYGIGPLPFSIFQLASVPEARWKDYIIKKTTVDLQLLSVNEKRGRAITGNKLRMYRFCREVGLPTIPILCSVGNLRDPADACVEHVTSPERFQTLLASAPDRLFAKRIHGSHGTGAFVVTRDDAGFGFGGRHGTAGELLAYIEENCGPRNGFILQPQVRPHPGLGPLTSADGLPTSRLVTTMNADGPHLRFACFKIPTGTNVVDNFHDGLGGNLLAAIDLETGTLSPARGSARRDWPLLVQVDVHPDTGQRIAGLRLPLWEELREVALRGQRLLPGLKTIGWDMAIGPDGVLVVEANYKYDMHIHQMASQRGLETEFAALMDGLRT
jgi:hypothetical protein